MATLRSARPLFALLFSPAAHACTVCNSPTGHQVRAGLFNGHFFGTLLLVLAPFPVFALAVLLLYLGMPDLAGPDPLPASSVPPEPGILLETA